MSEQSHAYLIIAHDNLYVLRRLVELLDDRRTTIYIHLDQALGEVDESSLASACTHAQLFFIDRQHVRWGHYSIVEVVLRLLRAAVPGDHDYYHLLSGSDLPLQTPNHIYDFFSAHDGEEFVGFSPVFDPRWATELHLLPHLARPKDRVERMARRLIHDPFIRLQRVIGHDHFARSGMTVKKGSDWYSISHSLATHVLESEELVHRLFRFSHSASEMFVHTLVWNSSFRERLHDPDDEYRGSVRLIDWERGSPYVFTSEDLAELTSSTRLFARKFRSEVDSDVVDLLHLDLIGRQRAEIPPTNPPNEQG